MIGSIPLKSATVPEYNSPSENNAKSIQNFESLKYVAVMVEFHKKGIQFWGHKEGEVVIFSRGLKNNDENDDTAIWKRYNRNGISFIFLNIVNILIIFYQTSVFYLCIVLSRVNLIGKPSNAVISTRMRYMPSAYVTRIIMRCVRPLIAQMCLLNCPKCNCVNCPIVAAWIGGEIAMVEEPFINYVFRLFWFCHVISEILLQMC